MPVDYQQLRSQIRDLGEQAQRAEGRLRELREQANRLLETHAADLEQLALKVEIAAIANSGLRCAVPWRESLTGAWDAPLPQTPLTVIAADGSQILPDRHAAVEYGLINLGAFIMALDAGKRPQEVTFSRLLHNDTLRDAEGNLLGEDYINLLRNAEERRMLAELSRAQTAPVVALTDGPLELYGQPQTTARFRSLYDGYLHALRANAGPRCAAAGYVDKPQADLVVRLLELAGLTDEQLAASSALDHFLMGVRDAHLFAQRLQPGQRSAVFGLQSVSRKDFHGILELHFFYLNVGTSRHPALARVEIPAWVAENQSLLNQVHAALVYLSEQTGARRYPYALHRAHEIAVVHYDEKQYLENLIQIELSDRGLEAGERSNKQANKELSTSRKRYQP